MDKQYQIYVCEFDWYSEYTDKDLHEYIVMMAESTAEAVEAIERRFTYTDNITIHKYDDSRFISLNKTLFNRLLNTEAGLAYEEETETIERCGEDDAFAKAVAAEFGEGLDEDDVRATPESANDHGEIPVTDEEDARWNEMGHALERCSYY